MSKRYTVELDRDEITTLIEFLHTQEDFFIGQADDESAECVRLRIRALKRVLKQRSEQ